MLEDTFRFQSDAAGQVVNLSTKRFCKEIFVPTQKTINKNTINKQLEDFFRRVKLRAHFKSKKNKNLSSEEDRFKNQQIKIGYAPTIS